MLEVNEASKAAIKAALQSDKLCVYLLFIGENPVILPYEYGGDFERHLSETLVEYAYPEDAGKVKAILDSAGNILAKGYVAVIQHRVLEGKIVVGEADRGYTLEKLSYDDVIEHLSSAKELLLKLQALALSEAKVD